LGACTQRDGIIAQSIVSYNLSSTIGKYKRHKIVSLLQHYLRTSANRTRFIKDKKERVHFLFKYWTNVIQPQAGDKATIKLPFFLSWLYFFIRPFRILLRKKENPAT
jgi:hypothetical protein